jgi:hypothetical protein
MRRIGADINDGWALKLDEGAKPLGQVQPFIRIDPQYNNPFDQVRIDVCPEKSDFASLFSTISNNEFVCAGQNGIYLIIKTKTTETLDALEEVVKEFNDAQQREHEKKQELERQQAAKTGGFFIDSRPIPSYKFFRTKNMCALAIMVQHPFMDKLKALETAFQEKFKDFPVDKCDQSLNILKSRLARWVFKAMK